MLPKHLFYIGVGKEENTSQDKNLSSHFTCQQHLLSADEFQPLGLEIPKPVVSNKQNSRGNFRFKPVSLPLKGLSEKQYPQFLWFLLEARNILRKSESSEGKDNTQPAKIHRWGFPVCFLTLEEAAKQTKGHKTFGRLRKKSSSGRIFFLAWWRVEAAGIPLS